MMDAGFFNYIFKYYSTGTTKDSLGQVIDSPVLEGSFYGSKLVWQNREQYEGKQLIESSIVIIRTYFFDIDSTFILEDEDGIFYNIKGVKPIGFNDYIEITAQTKSNR